MAFAANTVKQRVRRLPGPNGCTVVEGIAKFSTTDASGTFDMQVARADSFVVTPLGAVATDENLYVDMAAQVIDGQIVRPTTGLATISRTGAAKTSNLWVSFRYTGF